MKFILDTYKDIWQYFWEQRIVYIPEEHSFYMNRIGIRVDIELMLNKISLAVKDHIIVNVSGFCGLSKSMKSNCEVPEFKKGILRVENDLNYGFAYGISDDNNYEYPVYINFQSGWVCIGNPDKKGDAVEFINNCVAVIDKEKEFVSLWVKPDRLPDI